MESLVEVLRGDGPDGLTWRILAGGTEDDFRTYVERRHGDARATSGMRGPKLYPGQRINIWTGRADGIPPFVMVRGAVEVTGVVALGRSGREYPLALSGVIEDFQLKFGGLFWPAGDPIVDLRVDLGT
jgi:hypothetical protein